MWSRFRGLWTTRTTMWFRTTTRSTSQGACPVISRTTGPGTSARRHAASCLPSVPGVITSLSMRSIGDRRRRTTSSAASPEFVASTQMVGVSGNDQVNHRLVIHEEDGRRKQELDWQGDLEEAPGECGAAPPSSRECVSRMAGLQPNEPEAALDSNQREALSLRPCGRSQVTRLLLIRHAHTLSNVGSGTALSGLTDTPLSSRGRYEVETLRSCARNAGPVAAIYTSPLRRALETASALEMAGPGPCRVLPALQEIDCGFVDGLPIHDVRCRHPDLWAANLRQDDDRFRWPGGESYREFRCRCLRAIRAIAQAHPGECVAVVTHAGVISQILGALQGINLPAGRRIALGMPASPRSSGDGARVSC
jgi:broad specificity phosphatase PhoE